MQYFENFKKIAPEQLRQWLNDDKDLRLIDTLPDEVYDHRHIPGAEN